VIDAPDQPAEFPPTLNPTLSDGQLPQRSSLDAHFATLDELCGLSEVVMDRMKSCRIHSPNRLTFARTFTSIFCACSGAGSLARSENTDYMDYQQSASRPILGLERHKPDAAICHARELFTRYQGMHVSSVLFLCVCVCVCAGEREASPTQLPKKELKETISAGSTKQLRERRRIAP
jgi:hypothetical protein